MARTHLNLRLRDVLRRCRLAKPSATHPQVGPSGSRAAVNPVALVILVLFVIWLLTAGYDLASAVAAAVAVAVSWAGGGAAGGAPPLPGPAH